MFGSQAPQSEVVGQLGSTYIEDTNVHTGTFGIIYCLTACTFTTLTSGTLPDGSTTVMQGTLANITLSPGMAIYGLFTTITLASGHVIAYNV